MNIPDLLSELCRLGITIVIDSGQLKLRAPRGVITAELRNSVAEHKAQIIEAFGDGVFPDATLPDVIKIPVWCPNTLTAVRSCIDSQRLKAA
jgi:hypothetical protein